ncbi:hypothetical protein GCM10007416_34540 [Kroppenstedtia guangzhouensis]|uniref:Teneurin-like YD-shell domain-containing protein n=1 Tax=Kroppenstedtia guangzhouensis TaxID=1274356 RepID=A0ABQ1H6H1_9BACL|nr:hypothetical protein GCM10007416_34540 [Kroppenstedtia guangzhouensis]
MDKGGEQRESYTYTYDNKGNITQVKDSKGTTSYVYDELEQLVKETRPDGMRKTMTTGSQTITFHYDGNNNVIYETDQNNQIVAHYTYGANHELVSMTRGGKTYYYQTNYRGDVTALTDSTGAVVATYEYDAFGNLLKETGTVENPYRYAGYRYDEVTGLYYLQSRYYNPETGRFLTRDVFEGVDTEPLSQNKYTYGHNNPVMNTDHSGYAVPMAVVAALKYLASVAGWALVITIAGLIKDTRSINPRKWGARRFAKDFAWNFVWGLVPFGGLKKIRPLWQWTYAVAYSYGLRFHRWLIGKLATGIVIARLKRYSAVQAFKRVVRNKLLRWRRR